MREIKFRAWDKKNKKMIYANKNGYDYEREGFYIGLDGKLYIFADDGACGDPECCGSPSYYMKEVSEDYIKLLSTGLKDKNGKEIYEGDILSLIEPEQVGVQTGYGLVEVLFGEYDDSEIDYGSDGIGWFVRGYHGYRRIDSTKDTYFIGYKGESAWSLLCVAKLWEIIGNIYENPELLKEVQK